MIRPDLIGKQIAAAMAALEAAYSLLEIEEQPADPEACPHEAKEYLSMGHWRCEDCGRKGEE
jgi:ribosomal protein L37AE/L43A